MKKLVVFFLSLSFCFTFSQEVDSLKTHEIKEVLVVGTKAALHEKQGKTLATLDEFLQKSTKVDLIKRGAYAWEPILNGMATERTVITIDGMRIFGACTDKMDPITSYVEVSNLSEATISSGQQGTCHGNTIGGAIDLKRSHRRFAKSGWEFIVNSGYESNNRQKIIGSAINYADSLFYIDTDVMFRDAENYKAGNNEEIEFSQFRKLNFSATSGYKLTKNKSIEASVIYDKATNVGYPALPMDVSLAEALITSLKFNYNPKSAQIDNWETKLYYNTITHTMDDTKRPNVPIHMDMPGWSDTYGFYSKINGKHNKHSFLANLSSFYNRSVAEMTMYPSDPNEKLMFMLTWPDVCTLYSGIYLEDSYEFNCHSNLKISANLGYHNNNVVSDFGLHSLQIFYPEMEAANSRLLKSIAANYLHDLNGFSYGVGMGYGERSPSVSEGYGFYLYNSFDGFDYIGNPNLKNEKSLEGNATIGYKNSKWKTRLSASYFHIYDYIMGVPNASVAPMTIGANGIKIYTALDFASILSSDFTVSYQLADNWIWKGQWVYNLGKDNESNGLPFMSPFNYLTSLEFKPGKFRSEIVLKGNATQTEYNIFYGEDKTPDYSIVNANIGYKFTFDKAKLVLNTGFENIFDANYTTYTDWNNLPRMGRNVFVNLMFQF